MLIKGHATPEGTSLFRTQSSGSGDKQSTGSGGDTFTPDFYRALGDNLHASSIGVGTYLGECDETEDAQYSAVISAALKRGINLIDTAINYRCQRSERAIGRALRSALKGNSDARTGIIVCTKGGYIPMEANPPATREEYTSYLRREYFDRGIMQPFDIVAGGHCLTPAYLADQIERSRRNMGIETIDLYYLHNPEQQLDAIERSQFRDVIRRAFETLESAVSDGRIRAYGCATWNGFRVPEEDKCHLNLEELVGLAREAGGPSHHFTTIQLPINLAMPEAVRSATQRVGKNAMPVLNAASELGVSVVASATLMQSQLAKALPNQIREAFPGLDTDAQCAIAFVRSLPVVAALVGMKTLAHLEENLGAARA